MQHDLFGKYLEEKKKSNNNFYSYGPVKKNKVYHNNRDISFSSNFDDFNNISVNQSISQPVNASIGQYQHNDESFNCYSSVQYNPNISILSNNNRSFTRQNSVEKVVHMGYAKIPANLIKKQPALQKSQSRQSISTNKSMNLHSQYGQKTGNTPFKAKQVPQPKVPFVVYKSTKALTVPKDPNISTGRSRSKSTTKRGGESAQEILERLRAKSQEKIIVKNLSKVKEGNLLEKFKASIAKEVNKPLRDITNSGLSQEQVEFRRKLLKEYNFGYKY